MHHYLLHIHQLAKKKKRQTYIYYLFLIPQSSGEALINCRFLFLESRADNEHLPIFFLYAQVMISMRVYSLHNLVHYRILFSRLSRRDKVPIVDAIALLMQRERFNGFTQTAC
jgi:hypothetical protein